MGWGEECGKDKKDDELKFRCTEFEEKASCLNAVNRWKMGSVQLGGELRTSNKGLGVIHMK